LLMSRKLISFLFVLSPRYSFLNLSFPSPQIPFSPYSSPNPASALPVAWRHLRVAGPDLKRPLPIRDVGSIDAELVGVLFTRDLLVEEGLANTGACDTETGHPVNRIDGQAKAIGLVTDSEFQRRVDVALFLVATHMDVVLTWPAVGDAVDEPRVSVEVVATSVFSTSRALTHVDHFVHDQFLARLTIQKTLSR